MKHFIGVVGAVASVTCTSLVWAQDTSSKVEDVGKVLEEETRVYAGSCFYSRPPAVTPRDQPPAAIETARIFAPAATLFSGLASALAASTLDFAVGALKAAGSERSASAVVAFPANTWMYQLNEAGQLVVNPKIQCIQIISGSFWNGFQVFGAEAATPDAVTAITDEHLTSSTRKVKQSWDPNGAAVEIARWEAGTAYFDALKKRYRQLRWARFFMEVRVQQLEGTKDKFYLAPNGLYFEKPVQKSWYEWSGRETRNLLVTVTLSDPGNSQGAAFASIAMPFRDVERGTWLSPLYFEGMTSKALVAPGLPEPEGAAVAERQALLKKAAEEIALAEGQAPTRRSLPVNSVKTTAYRNALEAYCRSVDGYNASAKKAGREPFTAPECPVAMSEAQADLDEARRAFQESNARRDAAANRAKWSEGQQGVKCAPSRDAGGRFLHNCSMNVSDHLPVIVSATVVEIKEPSKFVAFLGDTLDKAKPSIQSAVDASLPVARATADEKERAAKEDFELAKADVAIAEQELASAKSEEKLSKAKELLAKKIEANRKARAAGLPEPYPIP